MAKNTIFELNGKAYDALSGALLGDAPRASHTAHVQHMPLQTATRQSGGSVDGIVAGPRRQPHHPATKHVSAHRPQPTKTLMRHAVKPPQPTKLRPTKAASTSGLQPQATLHPAAPTQPTAAPKLSTATIDPIRAHRARTVNRSQAVQHFRPAARVSQQANQAQTPHKLAPQNPLPAPHHQSHPVQNHRQPPMQSHITITSLHPPASNDDADFDLFTQALAEARSHEEPAPHESATQAIKRKGRKGRRILAVSASLAVFVALCGFVAFQNRDQIQLQMASAKAGFVASTPLYMPQGYDMSKMTYATGTVAASFKHPNQPAFVIVQKKSNWDSQTLLESFVATSDEEYKGYQSNGRTVYIYGKGNATWVNGGVWYQIKEAASLTDEQLVKIAASM